MSQSIFEPVVSCKEVGSGTDRVNLSSGSVMKSLLYWQLTHLNDWLIRSVTGRIIEWISHRLVDWLIRWLKGPQATRRKWDSACIDKKVRISVGYYCIHLIFYHKIRGENKHRAQLLHWSKFHSNCYRLQCLNIDYAIIFRNKHMLHSKSDITLLNMFTYLRMYV